MQQNQMKLYFFISLLIVYLVAFILQQQLFLSWDISWLLRAASLSMQGGTYTNDFFSPNPPVIMYFYRVPIFFSHLFSIHLVLAMRLYLFLIATISLIASYQLVAKRRFIVILASTFLILPMYDLGQRDQLLYVMAMPYLLLVIGRLEQIQVRTSYAISIGLFAGIAIAMKPQFLILPAIIELYYGVKKKEVFAFARPEIGAMCALYLSLLVMTVVYYPDFFTLIMPTVWQHYYAGVGASWSMLLLNKTMLFCLLPLTFFTTKQKPLMTVLTLSLIAYLFTYLAQPAAFPYHLIPAFATATLLVCIYLSSLLTHGGKIRFLPIIYALFFLLYFTNDIWTLLVFTPALFFSFFTILFLIGLYLLQKNIIKTLTATTCIMTVSFATYYMTIRDSFHQHTFIMTLAVLFGSLAFFVARQKTTFRNFNIMLLGALFTCYPVYQCYHVYCDGLSYRHGPLANLIDFFQSHPQYQSIYSLSENSTIVCPLIHYTKLSSASRFDCLWLLTTAPNKLSDMIADDIARHRPDLISVVNVSKHHLDYIHILSNNKRFLSEWRHYRHLTTMAWGSSPYQLELYERLAQHE